MNKTDVIEYFDKCALVWDQEMVRIAREKYSDCPQINVTCGDVEDINLQCQFDAVVIYNAFPHFCDKNILPITVVFSVAATIVFLALPGPLLSLFSASEEMLALGIPALRIISVTIVFASVTMILGYSASGMGNGIVNMLGTAIRQLVLLVPALYLFSMLFGIFHAWYAFWIAETAATLYAVITTIHE